MWLATKFGFFSVVLARKDSQSLDSTKVMIRARMREHLEALVAQFPDDLGELKIIESKHTDYRWRIICDKTIWAKCLAALGEQIDYGNFKAACAKEHGQNSNYVRALHEIWHVFATIQSKR